MSDEVKKARANVSEVMGFADEEERHVLLDRLIAAVREATMAEVSKDSARLDWLEQNAYRVSGPAEDNNPRWVVWGIDEEQDRIADTLRSAIDAARGGTDGK